MSKVRPTSWGNTPVYAVDYDDGGELREATFFDRREAEAFAAEQEPAGPEDEHQPPAWVREVVAAVASVPERLGEAIRGVRR